MLLKQIVCAMLITCSVMVQAQVPPPLPISDTMKMSNVIFNKVEVDATFPGGDGAWRDFLRKNLKPDVPVDNNSPAGKYTVIVKFVVSRDGSLSDIAAETNIGYGMEQEVIRIIKKSGNWTPAYQNKRSVNAYRRQPVTFLVEQDDYEISTKVPYTIFAGVDNRISIDVQKVKPEDVTATVSQGTITTSGDGTFIIKGAEPGRIIITVFNGKKNKKIGSSSFEVKAKN